MRLVARTTADALDRPAVRLDGVFQLVDQNRDDMVCTVWAAVWIIAIDVLDNRILGNEATEA